MRVAHGPLAQLAADLHKSSQPARQQAASPQAESTGASRELPSVRLFRDAFSRTRAQDHVVQATLRKPANAGPLNSQALVLQSLAAMQDLSPDYLRRFVAHVESLQWLEAAGAVLTVPASAKKPDGKASKPKPASPPRARRKADPPPS